MCNTCDNCVLIDNNCLCVYAPMKGIKISAIMPSVVMANLQVSSLIGDECFGDICDYTGDDENHISTLVRNNAYFKAWYARLIYSCWLEDYGSGQAHCEGLTVKLSDELSEFKVLESKDVNAKIKQNNCKVEVLEKQFMDWFKKSFPQCLKCEEKTGCNTCKQSLCNCNNIHTNDDFSDFMSINNRGRSF